MYSLGGIAAVPFVASVTDNLGRRYSILFGSTLMIFGGILQGAAQNYLVFIPIVATFLIARFILGSGFPLQSSPLLPWSQVRQSQNAELSHPKERATMTCLFHVCRYIGRGVEAHAILVKYHGEGDEISEFVKAEYTQIKKTLEVELKNTEMSWKELLSTPGMRKRVIIGSCLALFTRLIPGPLASAYRISDHFLAPNPGSIIGIHDNRTKNIVNLSNNCWGLFNATFFALTWLPRSTERTKSRASSQAVLALIFLYSPADNVGFSAIDLPAFLVELFPFHVRAKGITIFQWWGKVAGFFNQLVNPIGITAGWKYYIFYCIWIAFEVAFVYFMFPETSNRTLEELTFLYEDDHRREAVRQIGEEIQHEQGYSDADARDSDSVEDSDSRRGHGSTTHLLTDWEY
ncbi:hypothetical protein BU15DRAFT_65802 [Melanogaster broomeanus]|nr:hypothetical protein BU15DRAFT_65802 [Melanogaster broomeanus]